MSLKKCRQLRDFPVFNWEPYPGKGLVADIFIDPSEENIQPFDVVVLDDEAYTVKEIILYVGVQNNSMIGLVTEELCEAEDIEI